MTNLIEQHKVDVPEGTVGKWEVERFEISQSGASLDDLRSTLNGYGYRAVRPGSYTRLTHGNNVVMSDTRAEVMDHLTAIREIERHGGRILIHGLGLGLVVQAALRCPTVDSVDVVELNREVVELVGPHYLGRPLSEAASPDPYSPNERWASADQRLRIYLGDALTFKFAPGARWSVVWHDIWTDLTSDNLPEMHRLHRRYGRRCRWQGSWARAHVESARW